MSLEWMRGSSAAAVLVRRLGGSSGLMAGSVALNFLLAWVIARTLGVSESGRYFLLYNLLALLSLVARQGYDRVVLRRHAISLANGDVGRIRREQRHVAWRITWVSLLLAGGLWLLAPVLDGWLLKGEELAAGIRVLGIPIVLLALLQNIGEAFKGIHRVYTGVLLTAVLYPLLSIGFFLMLLWLKPMGLDGYLVALYALCLSLAVTLAVSWWMWWRQLADRGCTGSDLKGVHADTQPEMGSGDRGDLATARKPDSDGPGIEMSPRLYASSIAEYGLNAIPSLALGLVAVSQDVAFYEIARRIAMLLSFFLVSLNGIVGPQISALHASGDASGVRALTKRSALILHVLTLPMVILFLVAPAGWMGLFGPEFASGGIFLVVLMLGQIVNLATGSVGILLVMTHHDKEKLRSTMMGMAGMLASLPLTVHLFGALGVAMSTSLGAGFKNLSATWMVWRTFGFIPIWTPSIGGLAAIFRYRPRTPRR